MIIQKNFKVAGLSNNRNSFGLRGTVIMAADGQSYEIRVSYLYQDKTAIGSTLIGMVSDKTGKLQAIAGVSYELPRELPNAPQAVVNEVWKNEIKEVANEQS